MSSNWNSPENDITPEEIMKSGQRPPPPGTADPSGQDDTTEPRKVSRRNWLGITGALAGVAVAGGAWLYAFRRGTDEEVLAAGQTGLSSHPGYPARTNPAFASGGRPLTEEAAAARYCNFYEITGGKDVYRYIENFKTDPWTIEVTGAVRNPKTYDMDAIHNTFTLEERVYRHRCVEAWAMVVPWTGFPLAELIRAADPLSDARYVKFVSFFDPQVATRQRLSHFPWPYTEGLTLAEATNPLAFVATGMYGHPLLKQHGAPIRLVIPWKYGYKSCKSIVRIELTRERPSTFWNSLQPNEYGFQSNVNPNIPHPRWSQAEERMLGTDERYPTRLYNGYEEWVAELYS